MFNEFNAVLSTVYLFLISFHHNHSIPLSISIIQLDISAIRSRTQAFVNMNLYFLSCVEFQKKKRFLLNGSVFDDISRHMALQHVNIFYRPFSARLNEICKAYYQKVISLEDEKYDMEKEVEFKDYRVILRMVFFFAVFILNSLNNPEYTYVCKLHKRKRFYPLLKQNNYIIKTGQLLTKLCICLFKK